MLFSELWVQVYSVYHIIYSSVNHRDVEILLIRVLFIK